MPKSYDLGFKWKIVTILMVVSLCSGLFYRRSLDSASAFVQHLTGRLYFPIFNFISEKLPHINLKKHIFHNEKIDVILIPPNLDRQKNQDDKKKPCPSVRNNEKTEDNDAEIAWKKKWREKYAILVKKLTEAGTRVIVFDIAFDKEIDKKVDIDLIEAIKQAKKRGTSVIIGYAEVSPDDTPFIADDFKDAVDKGYGLACVGRDWIDMIKNPLVVRGGQKTLYSISMKAVEAYWDGKIKPPDFNHRRIEIEQNNNICPNRICRFSDSQKIKLDGSDAPIKRRADIFINTSPEIPQLKYNEFEALSDDQLIHRFNGKIIMVGVSSEDDKHSVSLGTERYGVLILADAINAILNSTDDNISFQPLPEHLEYLFIFLFGLSGIICNSYISWWQTGMTRKQSAFAVSSIIFLMLIACIIFSFILYMEKHVIAKWIYYPIPFLLTLIIGWIHRFVLKRSSHEQNS